MQKACLLLLTAITLNLFAHPFVGPDGEPDRDALEQTHKKRERLYNDLNASDFQPTADKITNLETFASDLAEWAQLRPDVFSPTSPKTPLGLLALCAGSPNALAIAEAYLAQRPAEISEIEDANDGIRELEEHLQPYSTIMTVTSLINPETLQTDKDVFEFLELLKRIESFKELLLRLNNRQ